MFSTSLIIASFIAVFAGAGAARGLRRGINQADEGYLVYGVQALLRGETPIRDFRAYDPGRYLWCALFAICLGPGFLSARVAMSVLSAIAAIIIGVMVLHASENPFLAMLSGVLVVLWAQPRHKRGEPLFASLSMLGLVLLMVWPSASFPIGVMVAVGLLFGLNIFVYMMVSGAVFLAAHFVAGGVTPVDFVGLILGFIVGYAPIVVFALLRPGTVKAYWKQKIVPIIIRGEANLKLPLPWVFRPLPKHLMGNGRWRGHVVQVIFSIQPLVYLAAILLWTLLPAVRESPAGPLVLASAATGLAFFHHAVSRADLSHVCQSVAPLIVIVAVGVSALGSVWLGLIVPILLISLTYWLLYPTPDFSHEWGRHLPTEWLQTKHDRFRVDVNLHAHYCAVLDMAADELSNSDSVLSAPLDVSALALLNVRSAVYDTFPVYPADTDKQKRMLEQLLENRPLYALIGRQILDGREDLLFRRNYRDVFEYIECGYDLVRRTGHADLYRRRDM